MAGDIDKMLDERERTHGDFASVARVARGIRSAMTTACTSKLSDAQYEALTMIASKMARIVCGDPDVRDHWDDIAGYASLAARRARPPEVKCTECGAK